MKIKQVNDMSNKGVDPTRRGPMDFFMSDP
ncbi:calcineurin-like phosphoesterase superfamily domain protein [Vibrio phage 2.275.O._10N.286.54.E11]|nr:calcineurin-like phosphoesterase superfamily domain protein [Vibrio phage 2.275.O._10N.286.54.E11]